MGNIITLEQEKSNACMNEINAILKKYNMALTPSVTMATTGMSFKIDVVPVAAKMTTGGGADA